jgi:hypothetical protein
MRPGPNVMKNFMSVIYESLRMVTLATDKHSILWQTVNYSCNFYSNETRVKCYVKFFNRNIRVFEILN